MHQPGTERACTSLGQSEHAQPRLIPSAPRAGSLALVVKMVNCWHLQYIAPLSWGDVAQEVRAVGGLPVRSHPGRVEVSLSETPNPQLLLTSWLVPCMAANRRWCVSVCVEWVNERDKLYRALDMGAI